MKQLVFIENNQAVTDSLTVAEVFNKRHDHVVRDLETQIIKLKEAGEAKWGVTNFGETQYQHPQNKQWYTKYNLTEDAFAIIAMSYTTPEAMRMKIKFLNEFKSMKEKLQQPRVLSEKEQLKASMKLSLEASETLEKHDERISHLEESMRIDGVQEYQINQLGKKKVIKSLGGYKSPAYQMLSSKLFARFWRDFKQHFMIPRYSELPRKRFDEAIEFISVWQPDTSTRLEIQSANRQQSSYVRGVI